MKLGLMAYATKTGLGYQTRDYYNHLKPYKTMLVDISELNNQEQYYGWYKDFYLVKGIPRRPQIQRFLQDLDVVLFAETPLNYEFYTWAKRMGVRTVCVPNYEFLDYYVKHDIPYPDKFILPSVWNEDKFEILSKNHSFEYEYIHHPVDRNIFDFVQRKTKKFFHIAGRPAVHDRNGTWEFMEYFPNGKVITQSEEMATQIRERYRHSNVFTNIASPQDMYKLGDIMVLPRKYGGNCLPLNEALSSGCPVIMPDVSPNNHILPKEWLVRARPVGKFTPRTTVNLFRVYPEAMNKIIEYFKNCNMEEESIKAGKIADSISWETLKPKWEKALYE